MVGWWVCKLPGLSIHMHGTSYACAARNCRVGTLLAGTSCWSVSLHSGFTGVQPVEHGHCVHAWP